MVLFSVKIKRYLKLAIVQNNISIISCSVFVCIYWQPPTKSIMGNICWENFLQEIAPPSAGRHFLKERQMFLTVFFITGAISNRSSPEIFWTLLFEKTHSHYCIANLLRNLILTQMLVLNFVTF